MASVQVKLCQQRRPGGFVHVAICDGILDLWPRKSKLTMLSEMISNRLTVSMLP